MTYFVTSDQHYSHANIIKYCNRPFGSVHEMNSAITDRHNEVVKDGDIVIHAGDFTLENNTEYVYKNYVSKLNGAHIFIKGSHDYWLKKAPYLWEKNINGIYIVVCHYAMREWPRSFHGSFLFYGHSHGRLDHYKNSLDIGVDTNNFYPYSFEQAIEKIKERNLNG